MDHVKFYCQSKRRGEGGGGRLGSGGEGESGRCCDPAFRICERSLSGDLVRGVVREAREAATRMQAAYRGRQVWEQRDRGF